jgi:hypothetical protein
VLLVDNASSDGTAEGVAAAFPAVEIIRNPRNLGFAGGYNVGLRAALAGGCDLILLLNNDTLLAPDCLAELVAEMEAAEEVGLVTAKIYYAADRNRIWTVGGRLNPITLEVVAKGDDEIDRGQWAAGRDLDFAPLCGVLIRRTLLDKIGLLDEEYFMYYEDMDFCLRARQAGFRLRLAPAATMWHDVASSSGGRHSPSERYWMAQSSGRYFRTHGRGWRLPIIIPYRLASALKMTARLVGRGQYRATRAYWRGLLTGWLSGRAVTPPPDWVTRLA